MLLFYRGKRGTGSDGNEKVHHIPQSSSITEASPSDCLVSYPEHLLGGALTSQQRFSRCILQILAELGQNCNHLIINELPKLTNECLLMQLIFFCLHLDELALN